MTIKELCIIGTEKTVFDWYEDVMDFLKGEEIEESVIEEYDLVGILIDLKHPYKLTKQYDKILELEAVLRENQKPLFEKMEMYLMSDMLPYYCFQKDKKMLSSYVDRYIENPLQDIDLLFSSTRFLIYYNHADLVEKLNRNIYQIVSDSPKVWGGNMEMAGALLLIESQKYYEKYQETGVLDLTELGKDMDKFDYKNDGPLLAFLNEALQCDYTSDLNQLKTQFKKDREMFLNHLAIYFNRYMHERGISFLISGEIWNLIISYWMEENKKQHNKTNRFFGFKTNTLDRFLATKGGMFVDYRMDVFAGLWGACYLYDFLLSLQLIDQKLHQSFKAFYDKNTKIFTNGGNFNLWQYSFVHQWSKPDSVKEEVWEKEKQIFLDSFELKKEVSNKPILNPEWYEEEDEMEKEDIEQIMNTLVGDVLKKPPIVENKEEVATSSTKVKLPRKFGRNEKVTVRYPDGTVKEAKFKQVQKDLESEECELVF
ncbi:MAG: hypothetical protein R3E32_01805 [Chitinophagales bacterium]